MFITMAPLPGGSQIKASQRLARPGHPSDEADHLSSQVLCQVDGVGNIVSGPRQILCTCLGARNLLNGMAAI